MSDTAKELIAQIASVKKEAISNGVIREEKSLPPIESKEIPYNLPTGWQWIRLGDYALKVTDYVASGSFASLKENVLITNEPNYAIMVKTADFSNGFTKNLTYTDEHGYEFLSNSNLFGGELILSNIGSIGKVFIVPYLEQPMTLASNMVMVKMTDDRLIKYLYYYFLSQLGQRTLFSISSGTSMMKFNKTQLKNTLVPVAPLLVQQEIVKQIENVSKIIELRKEELQNLDNLIKSRFVEMFGDPQINDKGFTKAPMGEYLTVLTDFSSNGSYKTLDTGVTMYDEPNYAWMVRTTDLESGDMSSIKYIDENAYELLSKSKIYGGEIIMNKIGSAGKVYLMPEIDMPASLGRNAFMFRYDERINVLYMYYLLTSEYGKAEIQQYVRGAVTKTITKEDARAIMIIAPPIELQNEFANFIEQVDKLKSKVQKSLDETQELMDSLMQQYFG